MPVGEPGIVLVDLHLPGYTVEEVASFIKRVKIQTNFPVITISGRYEYESLDKAYEIGANLFLTKPHDLSGWTELLFSVRSYFL